MSAQTLEVQTDAQNTAKKSAGHIIVDTLVAHGVERTYVIPGKATSRFSMGCTIPPSKPSSAATRAAPPTWPRPTARCTSAPASPW